MSKIKVAVADDHAAIRLGVSALLRQTPDLELVGEARDARGAVELVAEKQPDVLLMDIGMRGGGIRAMERIREHNTHVRILAFTTYDGGSYLRAVLAAGGDGYLVKTAGGDEIIDAIRTVYSGHMYVDVETKTGFGNDLNFREGPLTSREREVLCEIAKGYTQREIADRLDLSPRTVETYRSRIAAKLGLKSRVDVTRYALETGILAPTDPYTSDIPPSG